jgi:F-type H+-transporting ATPase subunit epsilon
MTAKIRCVVVTPETTVIDETADFVAVPGYDGEVGVMNNRAPLVARLAPGELRLTTRGVSKRYFIDGGFVQVRDNVVTILTARARAADALALPELSKELETIRAEVPTTDEQIEEKLRRLQRTRAQLSIAGKSTD